MFLISPRRMRTFALAPIGDLSNALRGRLQHLRGRGWCDVRSKPTVGIYAVYHMNWTALIISAFALVAALVPFLLKKSPAVNNFMGFQTFSHSSLQLVPITREAFSLWWDAAGAYLLPASKHVYFFPTRTTDGEIGLKLDDIRLDGHDRTASVTTWVRAA